MLSRISPEHLVLCFWIFHFLVLPPDIFMNYNVLRTILKMLHVVQDLPLWFSMFHLLVVSKDEQLEIGKLNTRISEQFEKTHAEVASRRLAEIASMSAAC